MRRGIVRPGDNLAVCDRSGFVVYSSMLRREWNNLRVLERFWEVRHPQDFVRGIPDHQAAEDPRPRSINQFIGPLTTELAAGHSPGDSVMTVETSARFAPGDAILITNNLNDAERHTVLLVPTPTTLTLVGVLAQDASSGNAVVNTSAVSPSDVV